MIVATLWQKKKRHFKDMRVGGETDLPCVLLKTLKSVSVK